MGNDPSTDIIADTVIRHLAADEADLRARVAELEADVAIYRELVSNALAVAHSVTAERNSYRDRYHSVLDENRRLRAERAGAQRGRAA